MTVRTAACRKGLALLAVILLALLVAACTAQPSASASCADALPKAGRAVPVGGTGLALTVPDGWTQSIGDGPGSVNVVAQAAGLSVSVLVVFEDPDIALPIPGPSVTGSREVALDGLGSVPVDEIADGDRVGLRYTGPWRGGGVQVVASGPKGTCDGLLLALLALAGFPR